MSKFKELKETIKALGLTNWQFIKILFVMWLLKGLSDQGAANALQMISAEIAKERGINPYI